MTDYPIAYRCPMAGCAWDNTLMLTGNWDVIDSLVYGVVRDDVLRHWITKHWALRPAERAE